MSTGTYFDFQSVELYAAYEEETWSKWYSRLVKLELEGKETYFPERVCYSSNVICEANLPRWELFQEEFSGTLIQKNTILKIVKAWEELWKECKRPENATDCVPDDILNPEQVNNILKKYIGYHLTMRID